jgi:vancomycin resistance protein YoaR
MVRRYFLLTILCLLLFSTERLFAAEGEPTEILGSCATELLDHYGRTKNIELAVHSIQGYTLKPGRIFSFNRVVGSRSERRGFRPAPVLFQDKKSIQVGGGICQVSSTLYNAALLADMEILERSRHSSPVSYLPLGLDATVAYGYKDFKFRNGHPFSVVIDASLSEDFLTISILGKKKLPYDVDLTTRVTEIESPFSDQGSESGKEVIVYRLKRKEGLMIAKEYIGRDYYHPVKGEPQE